MDLTLSDFTAQLASAQPAPGGGGAAALTGALAASLTAMAANVTAANPRYAERSDALRSLIDACETQRTTLLALIEADAAGFLPLQKAYAIPRTDADRAAKLAAAAQTACLAPLAMLEHCAQTALLLTAAHLKRLVICSVRQADRLKHLHCLLISLLYGNALENQRQSHIFQRCQCRQ